MGRAAKNLGIRENLGIRYVVYQADTPPTPRRPAASPHSRERPSWAVDSPGAASYGKAALLSHPIVKLRRSEEETTMKWTTPRIVEIAVGLEINAYACAEIA
jgi:coenzyme PQQ precursor peptide PqqA